MPSTITDRASFRTQNYDYILPNAKISGKTRAEKNELLEKLFDADSAESVRNVGNRMVRDIDRIIADLDDSSVQNQNKYLFKKLDQLQRENER